jgi:hypothetical protein
LISNIKALKKWLYSLPHNQYNLSKCQRNIHKKRLKLTTKLVSLPLQNKVKIEALRQEITPTNPLIEKP